MNSAPIGRQPEETMDLLAADRAHVWHPYAPVGSEPFGIVTGAEGVRLHLADGSTPIDAMSSWWAVVHGYRHPVLDAAARSQLDQVAHVMFGGLTHEPAVTLASRLTSMTGLDRVFFSDSGSVSVEVALKMALQFQRGSDHPERTRFVSLAGGYHGDTFAAMSVCDPVGGMHSMFAGVLPQNTFLPRPPAGLDADLTAWKRACLAVIDELTDVAAIICEPVLQGAGGMYVYPPAAVGWLADQAKARGWLLVLDEIATGFRRLGTATFAFELAGVRPDILCVGKALSAGYLSLAATLCTEDVAEAIGRSESGVLMHGPTYMANPLACAVANASLDLLAEYTDLPDLSDALAPASDIAGVLDVRTVGSVGVIQLDHPVDVPKATATALEHGVWIRPFRDLIYAMPAYVMSADDQAVVADAMIAAASVA